MDSVEHVYDNGMMDKTTEPNTGTSKWEPEKEKQVLNNVSELLECPVCLTKMSAPIYQCPNGHTLCSMCKFKVNNRCPICRTDMGSIRCLALEKVLKPLEDHYECPFKDFGCRLTGNIPDLITHLKNDIHEVTIHDGCDINSKFAEPVSEIMDAGLWLQVFNCYGCYFCLYLERFIAYNNATGYVAYLRFMGDENAAKRFTYSLKIGRDGQKSTYKGVPRSIRVHTENFLNDGMLISPSFWKENEQLHWLTVKGQISEN